MSEQPKWTSGHEVTPNDKVFSVGHDWRVYRGVFLAMCKVNGWMPEDAT